MKNALEKHTQTYTHTIPDKATHRERGKEWKKNIQTNENHRQRFNTCAFHLNQCCGFNKTTQLNSISEPKRLKQD